MDPRDDETLLRLYAQRRDEAAFRELALRYGALVYAACLRDVRRPDWAEDAAQSVFVALARKAGRIRVKTSLVPWLYAASRLECRGLLRAERKRQKREVPLDESIPAPSQTSDVVLFQALDALSASQREAVVLRFVQGFSLAEVGRTQGVSEDAARMRIQRALERLRTEYVPAFAAPFGLLQRLASVPLPQATPIMTAPLLLASGGLSALAVVGAATATHPPATPVVLAPKPAKATPLKAKAIRAQEPSVPTLAVDPDPRLDVRATIEAPHATYAELGAWVQKTTGVPIYVVPAIRERKATVLVEDRPVRETMDRIAEGLWVEWGRTKEGYTLRLEPQAAAEEARYVKAEAEARQAGIREILDSLSSVGRIAPDRLKEEYDAANADADRLGKDKSPAAQQEANAARNRADRIYRALYVSGEHAADVLLASVSSARRESILEGHPLYVSERSGPGLGPVPPGVMEAAKNLTLQPDAPLIFGVEYQPMTGELRVVHAQPRSDGAGGGWLPLHGDESPAYRRALADEPYQKRLRAFVAVQEPTLLATKLVAEEPKAEPARPTPYCSLADVLIPLHRRTRLPIVADGYRVALVARHLPEGPDVAAWVRDLASTEHGFRGSRPNLHAAKGWLMFRGFRSWRQVGREVPEGPIRTLEAAYQKRGGATLDDYAAFAARVTPAQEPYLGGSDLVMDVPYQAIDGNVPFLRLWASLASGLRRQALSPNGLALGPLDSATIHLAIASVAGKLNLLTAMNPMLPFVLADSPPLPESLRLYVSLGLVTSQDFPDMVSGESYQYDPNQNRVPGASAVLRVPQASTFASYDVPFGPAIPIKMEKTRYTP